MQGVQKTCGQSTDVPELSRLLSSGLPRGHQRKDTVSAADSGSDTTEQPLSTVHARLDVDGQD